MLNILNINNFCQELSPILHTVGQMLNVFKICLPLILIVLGIFDIGKAVISSKSDDVKKNMKNFFKKLGVCLFIFFVPMVCMILFGFIADFSEIKEESGIDYDVCYDCMFDPDSDICKNAVELAELDS